MKYVITGGAGNISSPVVEKLLAAGHVVTVIGRHPENLKTLVAKGARAAIGSVEDTSFLKSVFAGADAVYTMVPPKWDAADWKGYIAGIGRNYAEALRGSSVRHVVNLSSIGAHTSDGCGPVSGLYRVEQEFNGLTEIDILHVRPSYFYYNLLANVPMVKHMNIMGSNFGGPDKKFSLSDPANIAETVAAELLALSFAGHKAIYIASDERTTDEIAHVLGAAIGKPDLPWVVFSDEQAMGGMLQAGLSEEVARNYTEMGHGIQTGHMTEDYWKHHPAELQSTKLEDFAKIFAEVYNQE